VPVYIRLDQQVRSAGLRLVHEHELLSPARQFGPYLGGDKVRLAISALHRILPLAYAADGLTGSERDLARALGIDPADREALLGSVIAVLDRDPAALAALLAELARRRDAAAEELAFELAARMRDEIEAIGWVTAEQKAARLEPDDFDVHRWADAVLVRFEVRAGRLGGWSQRACTEAVARSAVEATPALWQPFARRNAGLAVLLAG
jgi:excinuclease ABC subunit C